MYIVCWKLFNADKEKNQRSNFQDLERGQKKKQISSRRHIETYLDFDYKTQPYFCPHTKISFDCTSFLKKTNKQKIKYLIYDRISKAYPLKERHNL